MKNIKKRKSLNQSLYAVPEDQSRIAELTSGTADIIYPMDPNDAAQVDANEGSEVQQRPSANMTYLI